jgi:hypothetical protein
MNEAELFEIIKKYIPDLVKTDQFNPKDAYSKHYDLSIELKCRNKHYNKLLIEKIKYDSLIKNKNVRYICSTPLAIYSFDLHKIKEPNWVLSSLPMTSEFDNRSNIDKLIGCLDIDDAKKIKCEYSE